MPKAFIIAADKIIDQQGSLDHCNELEMRLAELGIHITELTIDPLSADWHRPAEEHSFRSGCAPIEALAKARQLIKSGEQAVVIYGKDHIKSDYSRDERSQLMAVYGKEYPLTQAYTDLSYEFIKRNNISEVQFKTMASALFENHKVSYQDYTADNNLEFALPEERWHQPVTKLFRGVDCANPVIDFCGRVLICNESLLKKLSIDKSQITEIKSVGLGRLNEDGKTQIKTIAEYAHLHKAYQQACIEADIDFVAAMQNGEALLDVYTCYPVVPMAFLLHSGLINHLDELTVFLEKHNITVTGGMNLARGAWNNPALNGLITMHQRLINDSKHLGLVHGNGGLGYRQGVAILGSL